MGPAEGPDGLVDGGTWPQAVRGEIQSGQLIDFWWHR